MKSARPDGGCRVIGDSSDMVKTVPTAWFGLFRVHHYAKNLLLLVPVLAAHRGVGDILSGRMLLALAAFCLCASAIYIVNDLLDADHDRQHPRKCHRPLAAGLVGRRTALGLSLVSLGLGAACAHAVGVAYLACLGLYCLCSLAYSAWLKKIVIVDCVVLAALYTLRVVAGGVALAVPLSFWLLAFSTFIFLSLAFVKRYAELRMQADRGQESSLGRGYLTDDAPLVQMLGVSTGVGSVLILALYVHSDAVAVLYARPEWIWGAVPVMLFWISWVWMLAHRGQMVDDPLLFALRDRVSLGVAVALAAIFALAAL